MTAPVETRAAASAQAEAIFAAVKNGLDPTTIVAQAVSAAATATQQATDASTARIVALWRRTDPNDADAVAKFIAQAGRVIISAQKAVASTAAAAQHAQLRAVGIDTKVPVTIPDNVRGAHVSLGADEPQVKRKPKVTVGYRDPDGGETKRVVTESDSAPERVFNRVVVTYQHERSRGADHSTATTAAEDRIGSIVDGNVTLAQRLGEQQTLAKVHAIDERVIGWRRVIHPELSKGGVCGLCVAASDRVYSVKDLKPIHLRCKCSVSPVTKTNDPGHRLNSSDLQRLYDDAGKALTGAALKRTRYSIEDHNELGPTLVRVDGGSVPHYSTEKPASSNRVRPSVQPAESASEVAARHLPALRASLKRLRDKGLADDSGPVKYHLAQIAKFEALAKAA